MTICACGTSNKKETRSEETRDQKESGETGVSPGTLGAGLAAPWGVGGFRDPNVDRQRLRGIQSTDHALYLGRTAPVGQR